MARFAANGFDRTTVRGIGADAGVSPALVLHHFTSKQDLRMACDEYVINQVMTRIEPWLTEPDAQLGQPGALAHLFADAEDVVAYIGRALVEGGQRTDELVDKFVDLTEEMFAAAEKQGTILPTKDPRARAAIVVLWDLTTIVLGRHLTRTLGESDPQAVLIRYGEFATEIFAHGMLAPSSTPDNPTR